MFNVNKRNSMVSRLGQREEIKKMQKKKKEAKLRRRKGEADADRLSLDETNSVEDEKAQKAKALRFDMSNAQKKLVK